MAAARKFLLLIYANVFPLLLPWPPRKGVGSERKNDKGLGRLFSRIVIYGRKVHPRDGSAKLQRNTRTRTSINRYKLPRCRGDFRTVISWRIFTFQTYGYRTPIHPRRSPVVQQSRYLSTTIAQKIVSGLRGSRAKPSRIETAFGR